MKLPRKKLNRYLQQRLKQCDHLPIRIHAVFDELRLFLQYHHQSKQIDVFELIIELVLRTDQQPAQDMAALLAVLDGNALCNLEEHDVVNAAGRRIT